jgi:hypothetical protein
MSGHFLRERLPAPRAFYETTLGGKLSCPNRKHWAVGRCPFHPSKTGRSFSVNLQSGGFFCHGCDAHGGDIVQFVRLRDKCSFKEAAQQLGVWDEVLSEDNRRSRAREVRRLEQIRHEREEYERREKSLRMEVRDALHLLERIERESVERLRAFDLDSTEAEREWAIMALAHELARQDEAAYFLLSFGPEHLRREYVDNPFARPRLERLQLTGCA